MWENGKAGDGTEEKKEGLVSTAICFLSLPPILTWRVQKQKLRNIFPSSELFHILHDQGQILRCLCEQLFVHLTYEPASVGHF